MKGLAIVLAACLIGTAAFAHAFLDHASPPVGAEVSTAPSAVALTYSESVEPRFSSIHVTNADGTAMEDGTPATESGGRVLSVRLKPLGPGVYDVRWHVTSVDTHKTEGHFSFTVKP